MTQAGLSEKKKIRVLIADDVHETRRSTRLMLSMIADIEVVAIATNGLEAVQMAREHRPDIVVLDINMPEMDGLTAYDQIVQGRPDTGCIIISAEKGFGLMRTAMSLGVQEYLFKPFTLEEMEQAVDRVVVRLEKKRLENRHTDRLRQQSEAYLKQLADEYARSKRTDDRAVDVFEQLAADPDCELRWLRTLAMLYVIRKEWNKLQTLAAKLAEGGK